MTNKTCTALAEIELLRTRRETALLAIHAALMAMPFAELAKLPEYALADIVKNSLRAEALTEEIKAAYSNSVTPLTENSHV